MKNVSNALLSDMRVLRKWCTIVFYTMRAAHMANVGTLLQQQQPSEPH